ncbi:HAD family hydrolase [Pinibacter soli]|uniref:HAD family hydrolase n=1 Tax=Pinibacter soli TaxID=3044211 RepID=A0ABT6RDG4_9BACT|nr:HAD family hydrolase [Pinibacter soli]MDI3320606.1 HAD family hydrolase [Pinibacter soli]
MKRKKAIIFDLDNTIYPVASIGVKLFDGLFQLVEKDKGFQGSIEDVKGAIQRKPFQDVAKAFHFSDDLTKAGLELLSDIEYNDVIKPFDDYLLTRNIDCLKFLVTKGFKKLQESKIRRLSLQNDFEAYYIVDPAVSDLSKKDVFNDIMKKYNLMPEDILVVGDDIHSEIQAAKDLGIDAVVYNFNGANEPAGYNIISHYEELNDYL